MAKPPSSPVRVGAATALAGPMPWGWRRRAQRSWLLTAEIAGGGGRAIGVAVDVADEASTLAMAAAATEAFGGIDILINNAALMVDVSYDSLDTVSMAAWNRAFAVNVNGALLCARAVAPSMRTRGGGRIVNQSSGGAFPASSLYGITKLALVNMAKTGLRATPSPRAMSCPMRARCWCPTIRRSSSF
jgi:NAD(P)-dependent dehydrogenase (short-subunit alcohol dehydrogenase family)